LPVPSAPKSTPTFREAALACGLVTVEQFDEAIRELSGDESSLSEGGATDQRIAELLVEQGTLTSYQADQILAGRTKLNLGPYIITDWIGQGGMGQVFKAVHNMMGREVAVKVLPLAKSTDEAIAHFHREIRLQAQLDHANLVRAYDAGHDGNVHYLVTEFVNGSDLRRLVRMNGRLSMHQAAKIISQASQGLSYAHQRGMLHRDVKPGNILVASDGVTKVSDLGLAGSIAEADADPRAGKIVGTADYLAPEQILNPRGITQTADIYSLGCTLYYAVTGKVPFPGGGTREKARRHLEETPWHPMRFNEDLTEDFVDIIADMMEKDPKDRIQSMAEVVDRMEPWVRESTVMPAERGRRSPWAEGPAPAVSNEAAASARGPGEGGHSGLSDEIDARSGYSDGSEASHGSQLTSRPSAAAQDTRPIGQDARPMVGPTRPPLPIPQPRPGDENSGGHVAAVGVALAVAIPAAMLIGALIMFGFMKLMGL